eukprot:Clim_evm81s134 gene=Clim_evmTU81s134
MDSTSEVTIDTLIFGLKFRKITSPHDIAKATVIALRHFISTARWNTAKELITLVRAEGRRLYSARSSENVPGNMVRRILFIIKSEYIQLQQDEGKDISTNTQALQNVDGLYTLADEGMLKYDKLYHQLKPRIMDAINEELLAELEGAISDISGQALEHVYSNEVIMTLGYSRTVEHFLLQSARKRKIQVIVSEAGPSCRGHELAKALSSHGVDVTVVADAAVFALMSRVNKVILGTQAVLADGGLMAINGSHALAMAARLHNVPVFVLAAMFKLAPEYPCSYDQDTFNNLVNPSKVYPFSSATGNLIDAQINRPTFDYVPPELITLFITNMGGHPPSYIYRILREVYRPEDFDLLGDEQMEE